MDSREDTKGAKDVNMGELSAVVDVSPSRESGKIMKPRPHPLLRAAALVTLAAFLAACTKNEIRGSVEEQHVQVDWEHTGTPVLNLPGGPSVRGVILSPSQWPLEASLKRLFRGDFLGVIDAFNWRFQPSTIPSGVLEDLYDAGYVPAYVRVVNASDQPVSFAPTSLVIRDGLGAELSSIDPVSLPDRFQKIDWKKTGIAVALTALLVVVIVLAASGKGDRGGGGIYIGGSSRGSGGPIDGSEEIPIDRPQGRAAGDEGADQAILKPDVIPPRTAREGVVFFLRSDASIVDWATAQLAAR